MARPKSEDSILAQATAMGIDPALLGDNMKKSTHIDKLIPKQPLQDEGRADAAANVDSALLAADLTKAKVEDDSPRKKEANVEVVYTAKTDMPYPGRYLIVSIEDLEDSFTLEEGKPKSFPASTARALCDYDHPYASIDKV